MNDKPFHSIAEIHAACEKMGLTPLDFKSADEYEKAYRGYKWYLIPFWRVGLILYSVPPDEKLGELPWESFYIETNGEEKHHIHYAEKKNADDLTWMQEKPTEDRPGEIVGRLWHWYDPQSMTPALVSLEGR